MAETKKFKIIELTTRQWWVSYVDEWIDIGTWRSISRATLMVKINGQSPYVYPAKSSIKILWNDNYVASKELPLGGFAETFNFDLTGQVPSGKNKFHMDYIVPFGSYLWIDYLYVELEVTGEGYLPPVAPPTQPTTWDIVWWIFVLIIIVALIATLAWSLPRLKKVIS